VEVRAGYAVSSTTSLAKQASDKLLSKADPVITDDFTNSWQLKFNSAVGIRWAPLYGKLSLFAEVPIHFQAYLSAGGGIGTVHRQSVVLCTAPGAGGSCASWFEENRTTWLATAAIGMRFFTHKSGAIRFEIRDYAFRDSYLVQIDRARGLAGVPTGVRAKNPGLNSIVFAELGYAFLF
jgi:outer membrane beta-barrel protein